MDDEDSIRGELSGRSIIFDKLDDRTGIFAHADVFVNLSRDNETVEEVYLYLTTDPDAQRYAIWDKIAEGIGNLQALRKITILDGNNDDDPLAPDWESLACILRRLRRGIHLCMNDDDSPLVWHT
jgi:hypothetical protein